MNLARLDQLARYLGISTLPEQAAERAIHQRAMIAIVMAIPVYLLFAIGNLLAYSAATMTFVSTLAALLSLAALVKLRHGNVGRLPGHLFTSALAVQVFGEMAINGGLNAPAAALTLLVIPAAIFTAGGKAAFPWSVATVLALAGIATFDLMAYLPANVLPDAAQRMDRLLSISAGMIVCATVVATFERHAQTAIGKLREERARFRHQALHDALTGLPNRSFFYTHAQDMLDHAKTHCSTCTLIYFDIDRFKQINDQHGHAIGDALLIAFAKRLASRVRRGDLAARLAGDEFVMIATTGDDDRARDHLEARLRTTVVEPFDLDGERIHVGMSIGFAHFPSDGDDLDTLTRIADERMYADKAARRASARRAPNVISIDRHSDRGSPSTVCSAVPAFAAESPTGATAPAQIQARSTRPVD